MAENNYDDLYKSTNLLMQSSWPEMLTWARLTSSTSSSKMSTTKMTRILHPLLESSFPPNWLDSMARTSRPKFGTQVPLQ